MQDERKNKPQLVRELTTLRAKLKRIEKPAAKRKRISRPIVANESAETDHPGSVCDGNLAEESLRLCNEHLGKVFRACPVSIAIARLEDNRLVEVNPAWLEMTGFSEEEAIGRTSIELNIFLEPRDRRNVLQKLRGRERVTDFEFQLRRKSGEIVDVLMSADLIRFGDEPCLLTLAQNITERRKVERALKESEERYRGLVEESPEAIAVHCGGSIVYVNSAGAKLFGAQSPEDLVGTSILHLIRPENREGVLERIEQMPLGHAVRFNDEKFIRLDGNAIYVDVTLIPTTVLGKPAVRVMLRDVTEHKQVERQLREAKDQYQQLVENINDVIFSLDDGGIITYVSPAIGVVGGYLPAELIGLPFSEFVLPEDLPIVNSGFQRTIRGELGPAEFRVLTKSGHIRWMRSSSRPIVRQGNATGISGVLNDITEDKWARERLALLGHTIRSIRECVSVTDKDDKILFVNDAFLKTYGHTNAEIIGKPISIVRSSTTEPAAEDVLQATLQGGWQGELVNRKKDGSEFPITLSTSIVRNDAGRLLGLVGIAADITERKRAEERIEEERNLLRSIINAIPDEIVVKDLERKFVLANMGCLRALGKQTLDQVVGLRDEDLIPERYVPDVREKENLVLRSGKTLLNDIPEPRRNPDTGELERVIMSTKTPLHDRSGRTVGLVTVNRNVTDWQRTLENLHRSEIRFRTIWDHSLDAMRLTDAEGNIVMVNQSFCQLFKKESEELVGRSLADTYLPRPDEDIVENYCARFRNRTMVPFLEAAVTIWSGEELFVEISNTLLSIPGQSELLLSVFHDITERKQVEEALQKSETRYRSLFANMLDGFAYCKMIFDDQNRPVDFVYLAVNSAFEKLTGLTNVEGKRVSEVLPDVKESSPELLERYGRVALTGNPEQFEYDFRPLNQRLSISVYSTEKGYFVAVFENITERRRAEERRITSQEQLRHLAGHLQSVREEERKHLSQEFHDQLGQTLTALKMDFAMLQRELADKTRDVSRSTLGEKIQLMEGLIDTGIQGIREIMSELHPVLLDQLGLVAALEWEVERFQKRSGLQCRFTSELGEIPFDPKKSIALFRIFQEAVTNVARHAHATTVEISVRREDDDVILEIRDNGIGIEPNAEHKARSFGLVGMRERAVLLGGTLEITGIKGRATTILVRMPYEQTLPDGGVAP